MGDCVGHGLDAATAMGQLRTAARAMLLENRDPAATLTALDGFAAAVPGAEYATVVCAVFDRHTNMVTYARAGHLPPLVVGRHGSTWLDRGLGVPLGVHHSVPRANAVHQCEDGAVVVLYSDGLIERRGESLDVGLARLVDAATELRALAVQQLADGLLSMLLPEPSSDDVVLVVKQLPTATH